jgi:hypothetical protein
VNDWLQKKYSVESQQSMQENTTIQYYEVQAKLYVRAILNIGWSIYLCNSSLSGLTIEQLRANERALHTAWDTCAIPSQM